MKKYIATIIFSIFAFCVIAQEDFSNIVWDLHITSDTSAKVNGASKKNVWIESGSINGDVYGGTEITVIGNKDSKTGPTFVKKNEGSFWSPKTYTYKFRGAELGFNATEEGSTSVYIYGGEFNDKVSAVNHDSGTIKYNGTVNKRTGNMYLYGGRYNSDITGVGMASSGEYTANTNIQILGTLSFGGGMGVYGGISGQSAGTGSLFGNTNINVAESGSATFVVGGNRMAGNLTGNTNISVVNNGTVGAIIGGNYINGSVASTSTITGNTSILVSNGNVGTISSTGSNSYELKGIVGAGINTTLTGTSKIEITGNSVVTGGITAGAMGWGTTSVDSTILNISGGTITVTGTSYVYSGAVDALSPDKIDNAIYGGSVATGKQQDKTSILEQQAINSASIMSINKGTYLNITGGSITGNIFGGGYAQGESDATYYGKMTVNGGANITVDAKNDISISGNIYGGGNQGTNGTSIVNDGVNVVFSNDNGKTLTFTGIVSGNGLNGAVVNGDKVFSFENYNGAFGGTIKDFDYVNIKSSALSGIIKLSDTASNVFVYGKSSIDNKLDGMTSITINKDAVLTISNSSLLSNVALTNNGQLVIENFDSENGVEVKGELVVDESLSLNITEESSAVVKSVENVTESFVESFVDVSVNEFTKAAAFDFDIILDAGESVTLSFFVNESNLNVENFKIYHQQDGEWKEAEDVSNVKYEDGYLSFDVSHFSAYGYVASAIPEPSTYAVILGALALGFAMYRRRK